MAPHLIRAFACLTVATLIQDVYGCIPSTPEPSARNLAHIVRNACFQDNRKMDGHVIKNVTGVQTYLDCQKKCQGEEYCNYFNYFKASRLCELNSKNYNSKEDSSVLIGRRSCEDDVHAGKTDRDFCDFRGFETETNLTVKYENDDWSLFLKYVKHRNCRISVEKVVETSNKFMATMYNSIRTKDNDNLIMSSFSLRTVLFVIFEGARGNTRDEIRHRMNFPSEDYMTKDGFANSRAATFSDPSNSLVLQNGAFVGSTVELEKDFEENLLRAYKADTIRLSSAPDESANTINNWASKSTNGRIPTIVNPDEMSSDLRLLFVNVISFSSAWDKQFDPEKTRNLTFYLDNEQTVKAEFMKTTEKHKFVDVPDLDATALELPFKNKLCSMILLIPKEKDGFKNMEDKTVWLTAATPKERMIARTIKNYLAEAHIVYLVLGSFDLNSIVFSKSVESDIYIPKFSIDSSHNMKEFLLSQNLTKIFDPTQADLTGITNEEIFVSDIIQKSVIKVNEVGAEAHVATVAKIVSKSLLPQVRANRPFFYMIRDNITGMFLFAGRIVNPSIMSE